MTRNILLFLAVFSVGKVFAQEPKTKRAKVKSDFVLDSLGQQELRASYLTYKRQGSGNTYMFDGIPAWRYFENMSKVEVLQILGKPNRTITRQSATTGETDESGQLAYTDSIIDKIQYDISSSVKECSSGISFGLRILPTPNPDDYYKTGMGTGVGFLFQFDCDEKSSPGRHEDIVIMEFWFNP